MRRTPLDRLDIFGNLNLTLNKATGFSTESKQQRQILLKPPNFNSPGDSIELLAITNDLELETMTHLQREMRAEIDHQEDINQDRIKEIFSIQKHLRKEFAKLNAYIKECEDKKRKAEQSVAGEKAKHDHWKAIIKRYRTDIETLTKFRNDITKTVKDMEPYETGIKQVVAEARVYTSEKDCMDRCDALMLVQTEILRGKKETLLEIETKRQEMVRMSKEAALAIMGFLNELTQLERDYYHAHHASLKWERVLANVKNYIVEQECTKRRVLDGIRTMHRTLCNRRGIQPLTISLEGQLDFIRDEIRILKYVTTECTKKKKEPTRIKRFHLT